MILEDKYVRFLIKYNITQSQYLVLHLVYRKRYDLIELYKKAFPSEDETMIGEYFIDDLIKKGFIINDGIEYQIGSKFKEIFVDKGISAEEIFDIYPKFYIKDKARTPLNIMDRKAFASLYADAINGLLDEHEEIKLDIKYGIENDLMNITIEKFVKSRYWESIRSIRLNTVHTANKEPEF